MSEIQKFDIGSYSVAAWQASMDGGHCRVQLIKFSLSGLAQSVLTAIQQAKSG